MPSFDRPSLDQIATAIEAQAPELASTVRPLSVLGEGYASIAVETAGGGVVRIPKRPESAAAAAVEVFKPNRPRPKPQTTAPQTRFRFVVFIKFCRSSWMLKWDRNAQTACPC